MRPIWLEENVHHIDIIIEQQNIQQFKIWMRLFRTLAFPLGPFNGKKPVSKDTNPETTNTNPNP